MSTDLVIKNQTQLEYQSDFLKGARAIANIYAKSNESLNLHFIWKKGNGLGLDLTDYKAIFTVRERKDGHVRAIECNTEGDADGLITLDWGGNINIVAPPSKLSDMYKTGQWTWDLVLTSPEGISTRLIQGDFFIDRSVSQIKEEETEND